MVAHFDEVGIKLLKVERKGDSSVHTIYLVEPLRIFLFKVAYSECEVVARSFHMGLKKLLSPRETSLI
jgi:hypothetical protein